MSNNIPMPPAGTLPIYPIETAPEGVDVLYAEIDSDSPRNANWINGQRSGEKVFWGGGLLEAELSDFDAWTPLPMVGKIGNLKWSLT